MSFLRNLINKRNDLRNQIPQDRSMPTMQPFPQPINPKMGGIRQVLPMQSITLPGGQTVQIPKINEQEINANLQSAGITPKMPRPTAMGAGLGRMFDSPMMTASALESTGVTPQSFSGGILGKGTPTQTTTPVDLGNPVTQTVGTPTRITTTPTTLAPYTGSNVPDPNYIPSLVRNETGLDALTQQLLFGLDGQGGFIPGARRAAEKTFFIPDGTPRVVEERRAELTPDQIASMDLVRRNIGAQDPFLRSAESQFRQSIGDVQIRKGDTVLHQIANAEPGSGNAKVILQNFFEWCPRDVFLSVRSDNEKACKFYEQIGMSLVGETSWARGTLPGKVYVMRK